MHSDQKMWGNKPFWGLGYEFDPQWTLTLEQKEMQRQLIELAQTSLRANAIESDRDLIFPRKNFEALAKLGLLGLLVPQKWGGLGQNHICAAMVVETIARYGCASTAMCYTMHLGATAAALLRAEGNPALLDILERLDKDVLIGTLSASDPETGSHSWYPISSEAAEEEGQWRITKKASWTTSGGFADWYIVWTTSPGFNGNYADLSCFLVLKDEVKTNPSEWDGLGLRGNQSGSLLVDNLLLSNNRLVGPLGDGARSNDEVVDPFFLLCSSACWNGIALGSIDIAKSHTTQKKHADMGMRVADYPTIQDCVGEAIIETNASRSFVFNMARCLDQITQNCDWSLHQEFPP